MRVHAIRWFFIQSGRIYLSIIISSIPTGVHGKACFSGYSTSTRPAEPSPASWHRDWSKPVPSASPSCSGFSRPSGNRTWSRRAVSQGRRMRYSDFRMVHFLPSIYTIIVVPANLSPLMCQQSSKVAVHRSKDSHSSEKKCNCFGFSSTISSRFYRFYFSFPLGFIKLTSIFRLDFIREDDDFLCISTSKPLRLAVCTTRFPASVT